MFHKFFPGFAVLSLLAVPLSAPATAAPDAPQATCTIAGPSAEFCSGITFTRLDSGQTPGASFWMHRDGFMAKVLIQTVTAERALRGEIEAQIIAMVSSQAGSIGHRFQFTDAASTTQHGASVGTISYSLSHDGSNQAILHSYLASQGVVVQVISQIARPGASRDPAALAAAHDAALKAIHLLKAPDPEA